MLVSDFADFERTLLMKLLSSAFAHRLCYLSYFHGDQGCSAGIVHVIIRFGNLGRLYSMWIFSLILTICTIYRIGLESTALVSDLETWSYLFR